jgi:hypothetical protein
MFGSRDLRAGLKAIWKSTRSRMFHGVLLTITSVGAAVAQTPGFGERPDQWALYESGPLRAHIQAILDAEHMLGAKVEYLHFDARDVGLGPVELFRLSLGSDCSKDFCYFALISSNFPNAPLTTICQFAFGALSHMFRPDGSTIFAFEFACPDGLTLQVALSQTHFTLTSKRSP